MRLVSGSIPSIRPVDESEDNRFLDDCTMVETSYENSSSGTNSDANEKSALPSNFSEPMTSDCLFNNANANQTHLVPGVIVLTPRRKDLAERRSMSESASLSEGQTESETESETSSDTSTTSSTNQLPLTDSAVDDALRAEPSAPAPETKVDPSYLTSFCDKTNLSHFNRFRIQYLIVHTAIMLADGLQGTHLYVLYEGYGYSVSSLYSLGFVAGALSSPFIGPMVDKIGRKKAAMLYCVLEMMINYLELFPIFAGLITSRIIGGITTNLLFSVFESWLVSEHRQRGFEEAKLEIILRDSTIVSNSAAIVSGYLAHTLASSLGPVGPFQGAVVLTFAALLLVGTCWNENFGSSCSKLTTWQGNMVGAYNTIVNDSKILRIGLIQGLTEGSLQTFVFLWSPALRAFAQSAPKDALGIDSDGEPAYGLLFGAFMACGVVGGFAEPMARKAITRITRFGSRNSDIDVSEHGALKPVAVDFLCTLCYLTCACLLMVPYMMNKDSPYSFSICVGAFFMYELMIGLYMPCEGVIRSIYMPNESICSLMTMLRVIVNVAVAVGVFSTNYVAFTTAFATLSVMMVTAAIIQISLVPKQELIEQLEGLTPFSFSSRKNKMS